MAVTEGEGVGAEQASPRFPLGLYSQGKLCPGQPPAALSLTAACLCQSCHWSPGCLALSPGAPRPLPSASAGVDSGQLLCALGLGPSSWLQVSLLPRIRFLPDLPQSVYDLSRPFESPTLRVVF